MLGNKNLILQIGIILAVFLVIILYSVFSTGSQISTMPEEEVVPMITPSSAPAASKPASQPRPQPRIDPAIIIVSPASGDKLVIGNYRNIVWNKALGSTGGLFLFDEDKREISGWIASSITDKQTSYYWDSRSVFLLRTSPDKKDIGTGKYTIRMVANGKQGEIISAPFFLILPTQVTVGTHTITIKDFAFSPNVTKVKKGDKVIFVNNDSITHRVLSTNFGPHTIPAGESVTMDTSFLSPFSYTYYCDIHPQMKPATLTVD